MQRVKNLIGLALQRLPDRLYLYLLFFKVKRQLLHLKNPQTFTAKIQWLKLYGNLEKFATYADKYTVRSYVEQVLGEEYLIPLLGVWDSFDDIDFAALPERFVLKATHGCNYNYICKDKSQINHTELRKVVSGWLSENFYVFEREPQYKFCKPQIICEAYIEDATGGLRDYKFFCTNGEPKLIQVDSDRFTNHKSDILDTNWNKVDYVSVATFGGLDSVIEQPKNLQKMLAVAQTLSSGFPFVRVDLYAVDDKVYFGELTFTPGSGLINFTPQSGDVELGKLIDLHSYSGSIAS